MVVLGHMAKSHHAPRVFWDHYAPAGVDIFFVISGYLITSILLREQDTTGTINLSQFYWRRSLRIFPAALVFFFFAFLFFWHSLHWYDIAAAMLYVANLDHGRPWILGHLWSLSIEEQFYLLWPTVLRKWYKHRIAILISVAVAAPACRLLMYALKVPRAGGDVFPMSGDAIAVGCLLAIFSSRIGEISRPVAAICALAMVTIPVFPATSAFRTTLLYLVLRPAFYCSTAAVILHVVRNPYRFLNAALVMWLGRISYSLYLWQQPFCADPRLRSGWLVIGALACACISYYVVEQPVLRFRERQSTGRNKVPAEDAQPCPLVA